MTRRERLTDAAISALAQAGLRGLTHRAVDEIAGVPTGSCSYYFRTRQALLQAAVERLAELDGLELAERPTLTAPTDITQIADAVAGLIEHWVTAGRERMLARYELSLEATRRPELHAVLVAAGKRHQDLAASMLGAVGAPDPAGQAPVFVALLDGLVFSHLAGAGGLQLSPDKLRGTLLRLLHTMTQPPQP
ncbi:TetR/AcrR family transcriptional regulator [Streptomyces sp. GC420]|uniref:TetR/AcrR family transcriptional regulator n=1 Tax=Streptomyces sp. GC420 TaxID=2697568 RepID=UPI0014153072|nr:TetR/AcrR family transcriptional regulator [Streptomyces sp. GC420]NBM16164.1 TetR family transcriptional regulator [Streptomyces sp. GC420]